MSAQGLRDLGQGHEPIRDPKVAAEVKRRGHIVNRLSVVTALTATALAVLADHAIG